MFVVLISVDFNLFSGIIKLTIACKIAHTQIVEIRFENIGLNHS